MGYLKPAIYDILPAEPYRIVRSCSCRSEKCVYKCTNKIRINANGKRLDIWLIYQCEICKHTYNLPLYSRITGRELDKKLFAALQRNDEAAVSRLASDRAYLQLRGARIFEEPPYRLQRAQGSRADNIWHFRNPCHMRIRCDKLMADCLDISRTEAKKMLDSQALTVEIISDTEFVVRYYPAAI